MVIVRTSATEKTQRPALPAAMNSVTHRVCERERERKSFKKCIRRTCTAVHLFSYKYELYLCVCILAIFASAFNINLSFFFFKNIISFTLLQNNTYLYFSIWENFEKEILIELWHCICKICCLNHCSSNEYTQNNDWVMRFLGIQVCFSQWERQVDKRLLWKIINLIRVMHSLYNGVIFC